jgi:hypothetical protein
MAVAYAAVLAAFVAANRRTLRLDTFAVAALVCFGLFVVFPRDVGGAGGTDLRWLLPAYLLPFCGTASVPVGPQRRALGVAFVACLIHAGTVSRYARRMDVQLDAYDRALAHVPAYARLLPVRDDKRTSPRVGPYDQYAFWHIIDKCGEVPGLWSKTGPGRGAPPIAHFRHFATITHTYQPPDFWTEAEPMRLDWPRIAREYDYLIGAVRNPRVRVYMASHARETFRAGDVSVYQVVAPAGARVRLDSAAVRSVCHVW